MSAPLKDYSAERIGRVWGEDDHLYLLLQLGRIDELAGKMANLAVRNAEVKREFERLEKCAKRN